MNNNSEFRLFVLTIFAFAISPATSISCYQCRSIDIDSQYQCTEYMDNYDLTPQPCKNDSNAAYCVKVIGHREGRGTKRYCSARNLGNYCDFFKRPGDRFAFMSCVYTCDSDGCNGSSRLQVFTYIIAVGIAVARCCTV